MSRRSILYPVLLVAANFLNSCSSNLTSTSSGGTDFPNTRTVAGALIDSHGGPATPTLVQLFPRNYNPVTDMEISNVYSDTTDSRGRYHFADVDTGVYTLQAVNIANRNGLLLRGIDVLHGNDTAHTDTLHTTGGVKIILQDGMDAQNGYVYVPGTRIVRFLKNNPGSVLLDSVPPGILPAVYYGVKNSPMSPYSLQDTVPVFEARITTLAYYELKFSKKLYFNTTASGAQVATAVTNFPVCVRLTSGNFNFSEAQKNGEDIRFSKPDGTPVPYEIEQWDFANSLAEIWVKIDTIFGNDSTHYVTMHWGNPNVTGASNGGAVFDTGAGFQGVWHLNGPVSGPVNDATINGYNGTAINMTAQTATHSAIGIGRRFAAGDSGYIIVPGTATGKLNFRENGVYSISAWVYIDTLDGTSHAIADKGDQQYNLEVFQNKWEFAEYKSTQKWDMSSTQASARQWTLVTGVRNQTKQYLFVNGQCVDSMIENQFKPGVDRNTGYNVMFGKTDGDSAADFPYYFHGRLDEIRMCNRTLNSDWIKLCYMNQKTDDQLILFHR
jgi:hypothetical protein